MMTFENVSKSFRTEHVETLAVSSATLSVSERDFLAITGRSGSGKSTLASLLGLLEKPTSGRIVFRGEDLSGQSDAHLSRLRRDHVGFVFQSFHLIPHLRVAENVELALDGLGLSRSDRRRRTAEVLERLGVSSRARHFPRELSGGQQQRVAIARALVRRPSLLVCDEPTGNLDTENGANVMSMLRQANEDGAAVVVVTHDPAIASSALRSVHMSDGQIEPPLNPS